ncbi:hypothetical protein FBEOM_5256 [Fusarium beomiforme]|uniref:Heterokaryon incompatibility domain-containing protein n=1 Tax=Fusarium beomiforme TaxID=44412 RepID=A0A9P5ALQ2_9HYPO|nr:hypothetical protein FBEOM_5256 [Fusarium beomiforme]
MTYQSSEGAQKFSVTSNCFAALKRLRRKDKPRVLWIDALAIDQSNIDERNHQVSLMSRIYSQAAGVIIYLGESAENSDLAIEFIMDCDDPSLDTSSLSFPRSDTLMQALRNFFLRPWFTRVWVIQEVFLSTEKTVYCGEKEFSWSVMENFKHYLVNTRLQFRLPYVLSTPGKHFEEKTREEIMLKSLLDSRHCEATDPRDKVYSLLPILNSYNKPLSIRPRYQDTLAKVYTDCAMALLQDRGWSLLYAVQSQSGIEGLPSWVPDWNVAPQRHILGTAFMTDNSSFWIHTKLPAIPEKPQIMTRCTDAGQIPILQGHGYSCGKIARMGKTYIAGQMRFPAKEWLNLIKSIDTSLPAKQLGSDRKFRMDPFPRFLRMTVSLYSSNATQEDLGDDWTRPDFIVGGSHTSYQDYTFGDKWEQTVRKLALERKDGILPFRDIPFYHALASLPPSYANIIRENLQASHLRRLFVTDTGYFGIAPAEAEIGDEVFICVGAAVPFVLREAQMDREDEFHFVGESYVQVGAWYAMANTETQPQSLYII